MPNLWMKAAAVFVTTSAVMMAPVPAHATVHEIVAQWCSGHEPLHPRGVSGGSHGDNFAQPLFASGFIGDPVPFDPPGAQPAGLLLPFNFDNPNSKTMGTGVYVAIDTTPAGPLYIDLPAPNPKFAAFAHCPAFGS